MASRSSATRWLGFLIVLGLGVGCGGAGEEPPAAEPERPARVEMLPGPGESQTQAALRQEIHAGFEAAQARVAQKRMALEGTRLSVEQAEAALEDAEMRLAEAEASLQQELDTLTESETRLREVAIPDEVLFRAVQLELLEAPELHTVAIQAEVEGGSVTLRGKVPDEATREAATEIARGVAGVIEVENEIEVKQD